MNNTLYQLNQLSAIALSGEKIQHFLQGQLTCDMNAFTKSGDYSLAACCDHKGRLVANFWVLRRKDDFILILPTSLRDIVITHLQKYALFSKVVLTPCDDLRIFSANAPDIAQFDDKNIFILSLPNANRKLVLCPDTTLCPIKDDKNNNDDDDDDDDDDGDAAWTAENIKDHLALLSPNTSLLFTPQMISLEKQGGVSFTKGCYVGQEIIARTQHLGKLKRHLHRIHVKSDHPLQPGDPLLNEANEKVGVIVNAVFDSGHVDALAVIEDHALETMKQYIVI